MTGRQIDANESGPAQKNRGGQSGHSFWSSTPSTAKRDVELSPAQRWRTGRARRNSRRGNAGALRRDHAFRTCAMVRSLFLHYAMPFGELVEHQSAPKPSSRLNRLDPL